MTATTTTPTGGAVSSAPRVARALTILVVPSALSQSAVTVANTASTLLVTNTVGDSWPGLPGAAGVAGAPIGSLVLTPLMQSNGRRFGLITGYTTAFAVHRTSLSDLPVRTST